MKILIYFDIMIWNFIKIISNERLIQSIGKQNGWVSGNKKGDDLVEQESWDGKTKNMNESSCRFYVRVEKYQLHLLKMKNYKEQELSEWRVSPHAGDVIA